RRGVGKGIEHAEVVQPQKRVCPRFQAQGVVMRKVLFGDVQQGVPPHVTMSLAGRLPERRCTGHLTCYCTARRCALCTFRPCRPEISIRHTLETLCTGTRCTRIAVPALDTPAK